MRFRRGLMAHVSSTVLASFYLAGCAVTPVELSGEQLAEVASGAIADVARDQAAIAGPIGLQQAVERALRYNLDHQVELAEYAVRERELDLAHYSLMPSLVVDSGYAARDVVSASSSQNVATGAQSLATSTSQDLRLRAADATFSWNVLDFGLSYVRARQAADKVLIQNELRRKLTLRVVEDTRAAYWRAVSAQRLVGRLEDVERLAREVEREARNASSDRVASPITALTYEREIVEIQRTLAELRRELNIAKTQLGTLMNVAPGTKFTVVVPQQKVPSLPRQDAATLFHAAVANRPEMREAVYRRRINEQEMHAALLELLPGLNLYAAANFDSNSFLLHDHWSSWGAKASWNLLKVLSHRERRALVEEQDDMLEKKSLAVAMAVMTQVYVSRIRHAHAIKEFEIAKRYRDVQNRLLQQIRTEASADRVSRQTLAREELNAIVAEVKLDLAFAGVQSAHAYAISSLGIDPPLPDDSATSADTGAGAGRHRVAAR